MTIRALSLIAFLLALPLAVASADIGLVFDLDDTYQNGPDTLQIEPEDTVLVHVWITGAGDSLVSIGITLGDTTGALVWVEEEPDSFYTTPAGWVIIPGHLDSSGRVLIQAADFGHSAPLILPSQVAEVKFTVAPGESCGTVGWNPEESGWMDWGFVEGSFVQVEGASVCPGGALDGGTQGETGGESGEDAIPGGPAPPFDSSAGHTIVSLESWPTFPILKTMLSCNLSTQPALCGYLICFRQLPVDVVAVALFSPTGVALAEVPPVTSTAHRFGP